MDTFEPIGQIAIDEETVALLDAIAQGDESIDPELLSHLVPSKYGFANFLRDFGLTDDPDALELLRRIRSPFEMKRTTSMHGAPHGAAFGIYSSRATAEAAVDMFVAAGFSNQDVSVLMSDNQGSKDFAAEKNTKAPEGAATGVGVGGTVGGALGLLAGIGALAIPGVGPLIAAGPIMGALAGLGIGGAVGGLVGALVGIGIPEYEAKRYEGRVKDGGILVSIHYDRSDEFSRATDILKATGAEDIASSGEKSADSHGVDSETLSSYPTRR